VIALEGDAERAALLEAIEELLRPLMRSVLKFGLTHGDLVELVRGLYIGAVREQFVEQSRPVTVARLALVAGVTRGEAENIIDNRKRRRLARDENSTRAGRLVRLLTLWHEDSRFSTPYGAPLDLSLIPERAFKTFDGLLAATSIDGMDRESVLDELVAAGCVEIHENKFVRCVNRAFIPSGVDVYRISRLGRFVGALNSTFVHNLFRTTEEPSYFERAFLSEFPVNQEYRDQLLGYLRDDGQQFLDKLSRWSNEKEEPLKEHNGKRYGVGLYFYEEAKPLPSTNENSSVEFAGNA
jgi:hypothetical protein